MMRCWRDDPCEIACLLAGVLHIQDSIMFCTYFYMAESMIHKAPQKDPSLRRLCHRTLVARPCPESMDFCASSNLPAIAGAPRGCSQISL